MNDKEISELRRRFRPEKNNIAHIRGCYVNEKREIIAAFDEPLSLMPQEEAEQFLGVLRRTLAGTQGKNLIDITFSTQQVVDSDEHRLLMALRDSALKDEGAVQALYQRIIDQLNMEGQYLILLAADAYDVPYRAAGGERIDEASTEVYRYVVCSVCPVKEQKATLSYSAPQNEFHARAADRVVAAPELGFLFPAFDDRASNIYNALYFTRDTAQNHPEFVDALFRTELPMPADAQKNAFCTVLGETLAEECSFEVAQAVHEQLCEKIELHKASRDPEPLTVSRDEMRRVLDESGVSTGRIHAFEERCNTEFGPNTELSPRNLVDTAHFEVRTPEVVIRVDPERSDLIETRIIEGTRYILIRADEGVEVNGVAISIPDAAKG